MTTSGSAIFFDGKTSARHDVTRRARRPRRCASARADGAVLAEWPYDEIETLSAPDDVLRLGKFGNPVLARLEVRDPTLAAAIDDLSVPVDRSGRSERRMRRKVVLWSVAATASLVIVAVVGVPAIATRLAPLVPYPVERRLGDAVDAQVRSRARHRPVRRRVRMRTADRRRSGPRGVRQADAANSRRRPRCRIPLQPAVRAQSEANAFALPGGRIYVFQGLIDKAETPGRARRRASAHEIGHVAHRDGTRSVLQGAGLSFLFGMLLGDFVGGGAVMIAGQDHPADELFARGRDRGRRATA